MRDTVAPRLFLHLLLFPLEKIISSDINSLVGVIPILDLSPSELNEPVHKAPHSP